MTGLVEKKNRRGTRYFEDEDGEIAAKECTGCGEMKITGDFNKNKNKLGGVDPKCKSCRRKYCEDNREYFAEHARKYYEDNRARLAELGRKHYEANRAKVVERVRNYQIENPHVGSAARHRRRARKSLLPDTLTKEQLEEITDRFHGGCALTGCTDGIHLDHVIPVSVGHGGTTSQNMIPLRADLNISKQARCIFDWFYDVKDRFKLPQTKFDELIEYLAHINGMTADEYEDYVRGCHDNQRVLDETILDETGSAG